MALLSMLSLGVTLLASVPGQASLLSPSEAGLHPSARLLAQASPQSETEASPPPLVIAPEARIRELTLRVQDLNDRIRAMNTDWPVGALVATYSGYLLAPMLLVGIPLLIYGVSSDTDIAGTLAAIGTVATVLGGVGVALLIVGISAGISGSKDARAERQALISERTRLEDELRELKRRGDPSSHRWSPGLPARTVMTASFSF